MFSLKFCLDESSHRAMRQWNNQAETTEVCRYYKQHDSGYVGHKILRRELYIRVVDVIAPGQLPGVGQEGKDPLRITNIDLVPLI